MPLSTTASENWTTIVKHLVEVGAPTGPESIDYFSSLVPRHVQSYGRMMGKQYDATVTKEQIRTDWAESSVVDVLNRIASLEDEPYRRGVRILVHFLDFGMHRILDREKSRDNHHLRFEIYDLMQDLRNAKIGIDQVAYEETLNELRSIESAFRANG
jgi:hypothetical protein